jgi:hypothetical protein
MKRIFVVLANFIQKRQLERKNRQAASIISEQPLQMRNSWAGRQNTIFSYSHLIKIILSCKCEFVQLDFSTFS